MCESISIPRIGSLEISGDSDFCKYRLLMLEDNGTFADTASDMLRSQGPFAIDHARSVQEANERIENSTYEHVWVDILLEDKNNGHMQGDEWLLSNIDKLRMTRKDIVTGFPQRIKSMEKLRANGIGVIVKASDKEVEFVSEIIGLANEHKRIQIGKLIQRIESIYGEGIQESMSSERGIGEHIAKQAKLLFLDWIYSRKDQDSRDISIGEELYSLRELAEHVEENSEIGGKLLYLFVRQMRMRLGLAGNDDDNG